MFYLMFNYLLKLFYSSSFRSTFGIH